MKTLVKMGIDILSFGRIAELNHIEKRFSLEHARRLGKHPQWSSLATRQILITDYWFAVFKHYLSIILLPLFLIIAYVGSPQGSAGLVRVVI